MLDFESDQHEWLAQQFDALTAEMEVMTPSKWAEQKRYLPPSVTSLPGYYRFDVAPYLREPLDCLSVDSPVRELVVMKGVQICATVGILENAIGYFMDAVKTAPMCLLTANSDMAKLRMESYVTPMIQFSGLGHLIKSTDEKNTRKTGKTDRKIEWVGGGFLLPLGCQNPAALRSFSAQVLLRDEIDAYPDVIGKDGDPIKVSADRTAAYESSRKILDISTPLIKGQSKIEQRFRLGDQRYYFVCCLGCGHPQTLRWRRENPDTGEITGIVWDLDENKNLIPGSVRYLCEKCGHPHTNDDKTRLLSPEYGAHWKPTAEPSHPHIRSYHISALYSPVGMQTWEACVRKWLEAWDVEHNRPRDNGQLQVFYNNVLGETFEIRGEKLRFDTVSTHRRHSYSFGEIPNEWASQFCGSPVQILTCAVDVHADNLAVAVFGWCKDRRSVLVDYWRFSGDTEQLDDQATWGRLQELILAKTYVADDGKLYRLQLTLIDSGYRADQVYQFSELFTSGVFPVKGRELPPKSAAIKEFSEFVTPMGTRAYGITVDMYKDRLSAALRKPWDTMGLQPAGFFNAPINITDKQLKELTVETKREKVEKSTGKRLGFEWHRPSGAANELWDLLVYNAAALDIIAQDYCRNALELEFVNWAAFWEHCEQGAYFETG